MACRADGQPCECWIHRLLLDLDDAYGDFTQQRDSLTLARRIESLYAKLGERLKVALNPDRNPPLPGPD